MNDISLERFIKAQSNTYVAALNEIKSGRKRSHWMWFIFPQLRELGVSSISRYYGILGLDEAKAYLEHPVLSERLYELCGVLLNHKDKSAYEIFGDIDALKLKSSMTLFALISSDDSIFHKVLDYYYKVVGRQQLTLNCVAICVAVGEKLRNRIRKRGCLKCILKSV